MKISGLRAKYDGCRFVLDELLDRHWGNTSSHLPRSSYCPHHIHSGNASPTIYESV